MRELTNPAGRMTCLAVCLVFIGCEASEPVPALVPQKPSPATSSAPASSTSSYTPEPPKNKGLRETIVGKWIQRGMGDNPETMTFSQDGKFTRWAVSTKYSGSWKVVDESTIEVASASVLSGMRLTTEKLNVSLVDDILKISGRWEMGFRRDKTAEPGYFTSTTRSSDGRAEMEKLLVGTWEEATFSDNPDTMTFMLGGVVTFSNPRGSSGSYRVVDANTIEVNRTASLLVPAEVWTVKVDDRSLTIKGWRHSYIRKNRFAPRPVEEPPAAPEASPPSSVDGSVEEEVP